MLFGFVLFAGPGFRAGLKRRVKVQWHYGHDSRSGKKGG